MRLKKSRHQINMSSATSELFNNGDFAKKLLELCMDIALQSKFDNISANII